jgi:CBS domain-containing protein
MEPTVKDVMTTQVVSVHVHASFRTMAAALREHRISAFPVLDDQGKVIGVVSEADLLAKEALAEEHGIPAALTGILHHQEQKKSEGLTAGELMTHPAVTVHPGDSVEHAARLMYTLQVKRLPVVDAGGFLIDPAVFTVAVADGVVTIQGAPETADLGHNLVAKIRHIVGVVAVRDELAYPPAEHPIAGLYF